MEANSSAPLQLCIALRPTGLCTTPEQLCGNALCTYSVFSAPLTPTGNAYKCCPVRSWAQPDL